MASTGLLGINPYRKGNVAVDFLSKPTQLAIQLEQKEQAKAEALERYFMDYEKSINPKGLGRGEGDIFAKKYNQIREYWMQNKDAILHPTKYGYDAQSRYTSGLKDALSYIDQAKQATAERKAFVDYINKQKAQGKHISDNYLQVMENAMRPVEGGYVAPDFSQIKIYNPHDPIKFGQKLDLILKRTEGVPTKEFLPGSRTEFQWATPKTINKDEARSIAYSELQDDGYREYISNVTKDPVFLKSLGDVYKKRTGQNLNVNDLREVSYANVLAQAPDVVDRVKPELTESEKTRLALSRQKSTTPITMPEEGNLLDQIPDINLASGGKISSGIAYDKSGKPLNGEIYIEKTKLPNEWFSVIGNPKGVNGFNVKFIDGSPEVISNKRIGTINRQSMINYQRKYNTEPKSSPQLDFSNSKYTAISANGMKIYSRDGVNWFDNKGKKIQ
jgi:hypothetical protein